MTNQKHPHAFETTLQKTNEILRDIEDYFNWTEKDRAYLALRAVLHTLRDRMTIEQVTGLGAQLPMLVRGFYFEGWKPSSAPLKMNKDEFVGEVERQLDPFSYDQGTEELIKGVLTVIENHIDPAEMEKIKNAMPKDIKEMIGY